MIIILHIILLSLCFKIENAQIAVNFKSNYFTKYQVVDTRIM